MLSKHQTDRTIPYFYNDFRAISPSLAARQNCEAVAMSDFNEAIERVVAGLERRSRVLNENEKKTVAYHEVGHALIGALMPGAGKVEKIQQEFFGGFSNPRRSVSPKVAEDIDREVKGIVDGAHHIALSILDQNRDLLEETAQILLQQEILEGKQLHAQLNKVQAPSELEEWLRTGKLSPDKPLMQSVLV